MSTIETPRFPDDIAFGAIGGPEYKNIVSEQSGGHETNESKWTYPRHTYNVGHGVNTKEKYEDLLDYFHAMEGKRHKFRFKDWMDYNSAHTGDTIARTDQTIGTGDGANKTFQVIKTYTKGSISKVRNITKLVAGTLIVELNGTLQTLTTHYTVDEDTGIITFVTAPPGSQLVKCGYEFDVPVRFDQDKLGISLESIVVSNAVVTLKEVRV